MNIFIATSIPCYRCNLCFRFLTLKTVFLLALGSGRRRSELHALKPKIDILADGAVRYETIDGFLSKTQKPGDRPLTFTVLPNKDNPALCPVAALQQYAKATEVLRPNRTALFVSYVKPYKDISPDSISRWLCLVIRESYSSIDRPLQDHIQAHEIRAVSASMFLGGNNVDEILSTGLWSSKFSFLNHYRRVVDWDLSDFGSVVVVGKVLKGA